MTSFRGIDALTDYCNSPNKQTAGDEGTFSSGFKLRMVHIFIRHGDRTSIHRFPGYKPETYNCEFSTWYTGSNEKFRSFPQRMEKYPSEKRRKNPFLTWPQYPNQKTCKDSVLTSRGALQHLQLGQHLYDSYIKHSHLFEKSSSSLIYAKSTGTLRTYQSAVAFIYGFLPVTNISSFNIDYSEDLHFCSKKYSMKVTCSCPHTRDLFARSKRFQSAISKNSPYYRTLREFYTLFGIDDNDLILLAGIADALVPTYCHNLTIPCSTFNSSKCVDHSLLGTIWDAVTYKEFSKWDDPDLNFLKYSSIKMTPVLLEVVDRIKELIENNGKSTFILYSGHDVTISPLLYVLGLHDGRWPPYASRVVMELYEKENEDTNNKFYLKFLYNGFDKTEKVVFCKNRTLNGLCNFKLFTDFISRELLNRFGYVSYADACLR
ncbi:2-phosphoxylose phosphatase 1-like isoform X1 [Mercenaria mercenaria]|uniref:2-phosphoxylose phosphatase 1-like isoform X1 n=1 Tax=Mercenaria mercenaria TaxID=6596 RepID=UPI00234E9968|nr:2-phosphoxylose phosphatase 1-like isoform X1 [Mercenaria mercenaria]